MSNGTAYSLELPTSIKAAAERLAREDGVSLDQWIAVALAEKIGAVETAADFLRRKAGDAKPEDMLPLLENAGSEPPASDDEWPAGTRAG